MKYAFVRFEETKFEYIYVCANDRLCVGNVVSAPIGNYKQYKPALVLWIEELEDGQLPFPKSKILTLEKIISEGDCNFLFDNVGFMKSKTDAKLLEEWRFESENDWCKFYVSSFGGVISYQKDYVLTFELGDCTTDYYFNEYTLTSPDLFDVKIAFSESILSLLHYGKITEEEFAELLSKIT